ncbi:UNVERIFIED_CONTAM: hypothetical protein PYX00_009767 [Menopon gallinae]|uniref:NADH dehydrogenase [ubiquinone] 1 subunit C2 n=1 Tax=Menopon gallinae TaxID=328185 RepID=A0AAW2HCJ1_9NEOP
MAYARQPGAPKIPETPLEALEPREGEVFGLIDLYGMPVIAGGIGVGVPFYFNYKNKLPFYAGIWRPIVLGLSLGYIGLLVRDLKRETDADKDDVLRQYIRLHPERYPPFEKVLIKDILEPWEPRR